MNRYIAFGLFALALVVGGLYWGSQSQEVKDKQDQVAQNVTKPRDDAEYVRDISQDKDNELAKELDKQTEDNK